MNKLISSKLYKALKMKYKAEMCDAEATLEIYFTTKLILKKLYIIFKFLQLPNNTITLKQ